MAIARLRGGRLILLVIFVLDFLEVRVDDRIVARIGRPPSIVGGCLGRRLFGLVDRLAKLHRRVAQCLELGRDRLAVVAFEGFFQRREIAFDFRFFFLVLFGLGGVFTEVLKDVSFRRAPFGEETAREMIEELKGVALLKGARGRPAADLDALSRAISRLSLFAAAHGDAIDSVELNPLRALPDGCLALDALIVKKGL